MMRAWRNGNEHDGVTIETDRHDAVALNRRIEGNRITLQKIGLTIANHDDAGSHRSPGHSGKNRGCGRKTVARAKDRCENPEQALQRAATSE